MRRRLVVTALALWAVMGAAFIAAASPASAQTGYPPGQSTQCTGSQDVGAVTVGQQFVLQLAPTCLFNAGATVTINANGVTFSDTAEPNGSVLLTVNVLSTTEMSINPTVPARCGPNTVTATGPSRASATGVSTQTANFTLTCPTGTTPTTRGTGRGALSRTGADAVEYSAAALALVVAGSMLVIVTRRRRAANPFG